MGIDEIIEALFEDTPLGDLLFGSFKTMSLDEMEQFFESLPSALWTVLGVIAALALLLSIVAPILTLVGRYRAFKSAGLGGWRGAIPLYSWYVIGATRGGLPWVLAGILAGLSYAYGWAASDLHFEFFILALILQFLLLKCPTRAGGLSTGKSIGVVLLPFAFWFVVARDGSFAQGMRAGINHRAGEDELLPKRPQPRMALAFIVAALIGLELFLQLSNVADGWRRDRLHSESSDDALEISDGTTHVADIELLEAEIVQMDEDDETVPGLKVSYRATNVSDQTISLAYDVQTIISAYTDETELSQLEDYFTEDDYIYDEDAPTKLDAGESVETWLVFAPAKPGSQVSVRVLDYEYEGDVVSETTYTIDENGNLA